jgi:hypothetical protein
MFRHTNAIIRELIWSSQATYVGVHYRKNNGVSNNIASVSIVTLWKWVVMANCCWKQRTFVEHGPKCTPREYQEYFLGGKGGQCARLTLPPSCANCLEIWEPQSCGTPQGLSRPVMGLLYLYMYGCGDKLFMHMLKVTNNQESYGTSTNWMKSYTGLY